MLRSLARIAAVLAGAALTVGGLAGAADAARTCTAYGDSDPRTPGIQYGCVEWSGDDTSDDDTGSDNGNGNDNGSPAPPQCTFHGIYDDFCIGKRACYKNDPAAVQDVERAREDTPGLADKPADAERLIFTGCRETPDSEEVRRYYWDTELEETTVSVVDRIRAARGALRLPTVTATFNPPTRTLVNIETWWWAQGAPAAEIVGTPALGMRAIASPRGMTVSVAGQSVSCPLVTRMADTCAMQFRRAGDHPATMTLTYDIRFEMGGTVIPVPAGAQDLMTLTTTATTTVPVREVQSIVTDVD
ncbi:hypothetical protein AFL01nite_23180 [Aeromicrobium flavum]|uniref:Uncharacterized protein n=1 Tax=Aeromicrobium flavum TaxID=416568 RepID=A0A512HX27_9ACTN|nr:hypothetical protein AFL01nite_23180 [Aeromicrobium flavum]